VIVCSPVTRNAFDLPTNFTRFGGSRSTSSVSTEIVERIIGIGSATCQVARRSSWTSKDSTTLIAPARFSASEMNAHTSVAGASNSNVRETRTVIPVRWCHGG